MNAYLKIPGSVGFESSIPFDAKTSPLDHHIHNWSETASGYGRKLTTQYMVKIRNKWRRVYCCQISNAGTFYIGTTNAWEYIVESIE